MTLDWRDPYGSVVRLLAAAAGREAEAKGVKLEEKPEYLVSEPPRPEYGDLSFPAFRLARPLGVKPVEAARAVASRVESMMSGYPVSSVAAVGGYVNIRIDAPRLAELVFEAYRRLEERFGELPVEKPLRIVVEHTSANPVHPLHIGHARNSVLGDSLARLLEARGHAVQRRFYIDDVGRQVAVLAYGARILGDLRPEGKPDHWIGLVYAITHTVLDVRRLRDEARSLEEQGEIEEARARLRELDELVAAAAELREKNPEIFDKIAEAIKTDPDPEASISEIMKRYERGDPEVKELVRRVVELCLQGFEETLARMGIRFDKWDWESELVWSSLVGEVLEKARRSPYYTLHKGSEALDFSELQREPEIRRRLDLPSSFEIPPLILRRSDGTTLYTTRDIAYSIFKFRDFEADRVINVIAAEQRLPQIQIRLALIALGYRKEAYNMIHYAYEMVHLPGTRMSGRRGRYVSLDQMLSAAVERAREEVSKRSRQLSGREAERIAEAVGVGAVKYALLSVAAPKPMVFSLEEALNFERNSAPYIQYAHARAANILAKAGSAWKGSPDYRAAEAPVLRRRLLLLASKLPYVAAKAADEMRPELIVEYLGGLAETFNAWYPTDPVLRESDEGARAYKLALVDLTRHVLAKGLSLLGIEAPKRM